MNIKERKNFTLYTSQKFYKALDFLSKSEKKSKAQIINELIKGYLDANREKLDRKKIQYE